jgi:3-phosphoshikimate 1-carboxyvinyltransferase
MIVSSGKYKGVISIPASKSDSQRAIVCAGLSQGISTLTGVGNSADELAMINNIVSIGAEVSVANGNCIILGTVKFPNEISLNLGESGLGARLMSLLFIVHNGSFQLTGTGSLLNRTFAFFKENFEGKIPVISDNLGYLPLEIQGGFEGGELTVSGKLSSQYISGLLMALPLAKKDSDLYVEELNSKPYVQMTLDTIRSFGIEIDCADLKHFRIRGQQKYLPTNYKVEGDWSSASYWLIASALGQKISVEGLNMASLQADKAVLKAFSAANCTVENRKNRLFVRGTDRKPFSFDCTDCPDLFPTLAAFAALTEGKTSLFGLNRLVDKESNRGVTIQSEFGKLGIQIHLDEVNNVMHIEGKKSIFGGRVFSNNDHRIAMSLAILGMFSDNPIEIENSEAVKKSYPRFWKDLTSLKEESK